MQRECSLLSTSFYLEFITQSDTSFDLADVEVVLSDLLRSDAVPLEDNQTQADKLRQEIRDFHSKSARNFVFKDGILVDCLKNGGWVLLDGVEQAPQEVERLMSLLEEQPRLTVYEDKEPLFFFDDPNNPPPTIPEGFDTSPIHQDFPIFITCSEASQLSFALRSRCFCIQMSEPVDEAELLKIYSSAFVSHSPTSTPSGLLAPISVNLSIKARDLRQAGQPLRFANDFFSLPRLARVARGMGKVGIQPARLSTLLSMALTQCFSTKDDRDDVTTCAKALCDPQTDSSQSAETQNLQLLRKLCGQLEMAIVSRTEASTSPEHRIRQDFIDKHHCPSPEARKLCLLTELSRLLDCQQFTSTDTLNKANSSPSFDELVKELESELSKQLANLYVDDLLHASSILDQLYGVVKHLLPITTTEGLAVVSESVEMYSPGLKEEGIPTFCLNTSRPEHVALIHTG